MDFVIPDPDRYRLSDCGRYMIEKITLDGDTVYCVWQYATQAGGYRSMQECKDAIMEREFHRFQAASELGMVGVCPTCGQRDGAPPARPREALEADF